MEALASQNMAKIFLESMNKVEGYGFLPTKMVQKCLEDLIVVKDIVSYVLKFLIDVRS